jgi:hypothetical protein
MKRRDVLRLTQKALWLSAIPTSFLWPSSRPGRPQVRQRLYFEPDELTRIRANAESSLLGPTFQRWLQIDPETRKATINKVLETGDLLSDFSLALTGLYEEAIVYLVTQDPARKAVLETGLDLFRALPEWDYMREDQDQVLGLMRASKAAACTLFMMEVLDDHLTPAQKSELLQNVADKGCAPCYTTLWCMNNPSQVKGWSVAAD